MDRSVTAKPIQAPQVASTVSTEMERIKTTEFSTRKYRSPDLPSGQIAALPPAPAAENLSDGENSKGRLARNSTSLKPHQPNSVSELTKADVKSTEQVRRAFPGADIFLLVPLMTQLKLSSFIGDKGSLLTSKGNREYVVGLMESIGPRDGIETLLAMQMVATHGAAMQTLALANSADQTEMGKEMLLNRAAKLMRTFVMQMEALKKHRSNGEQHCTVEHVHVHNGGQAVVGTINQGRMSGTDGREDEESREKGDEEE